MIIIIQNDLAHVVYHVIFYPLMIGFLIIMIMIIFDFFSCSFGTRQQSGGFSTMSPTWTNFPPEYGWHGDAGMILFYLQPLSPDFFFFSFFFFIFHFFFSSPFCLPRFPAFFREKEVGGFHQQKCPAKKPPAALPPSRSS